LSLNKLIEDKKHYFMITKNQSNYLKPQCEVIGIGVRQVFAGSSVGNFDVTNVFESWPEEEEL